MEKPVLIAYNDRIGSLTLAIISSGLPIYFFLGPYEKTRVILHPFKFASIFLLLFIFGFPTYFFYTYFDRRVKLIINEDGIEFASKRFVKWEEIWYYYFVVTTHDGASTSLVVKLKEKEGEESDENEIQQPVDNLNRKVTQIRNILRHYSSIHGFLEMEDLKNPNY